MSKKIENDSGLTVCSKSFYGEIEYEMPKEMAKQILATRKGAEQNVHPQEFLKRVVNEEFGLKGYCTNVIVFS